MKKSLTSILIILLMMVSTINVLAAEVVNEKKQTVESGFIVEDVFETIKKKNKVSKKIYFLNNENTIQLPTENYEYAIKLLTESQSERESKSQSDISETNINIGGSIVEIHNTLESNQVFDLYTYEFQNIPGANLKYSQESDDVILVYDENDLLVCVVENTGLLNANENDGRTVLNIDGNKITQNIKMNQDLAYPVNFGINVYNTSVAKALLDWFDDAHWIWRNNELSLSLYPKEWCQNTNVTTALKETTWGVVCNYFRTEAYWSNESGLRDQYLCHVDYAKYKIPWNLEPWRADVSYSETVAAACNP